MTSVRFYRAVFLCDESMVHESGLTGQTRHTTFQAKNVDNKMIATGGLLMRYFCVMALAMMVGFSGNAFSSGHQIPFDQRHFSYYDEKNIMQRMTLAPKIGIRFVREVSEEERNEFLAQFVYTAQTKDPKDASRIFLDFAPNTKSSDLLKMLGQITGSDIAEVTPVFLIDQIEAIVEGVAIEPKMLLSPDDVERRIRRFGGFTLGSATAIQNGWTFPVSKITPPLNLFILIHLAHEDDWVRRAMPYFRYLHDPIVSNLSIAPLSGTVNETRTLSLSIRIYDPKIKIDEQLLPKFGEGTFVPKMNNIPAPFYLFQVLGEREKREVVRDRGREFIYSWVFAHYAIGEWTVPPQAIAYAAGESPNKIDASPATMVVTSLIGNFAVNDMPRPLLLPVPDNTIPAGINDALLPVLPVYWFDVWHVDAGRIVFYARPVAGASATGGLIFACLVMVSWMKRVRKKAAAKKAFFLRIEALCAEALEHHAYVPLYEAVSAILTRAFPDLPAHPTYADVESKRGIRWHGYDELSLMTKIKSLFNELGHAYIKDFSPSRAAVELLCDNVRDLAAALGSASDAYEEKRS